MPDSIVSACNELDGVKVLWISRYAAGGNVFLDLEAVEDLTAHPAEALDRLVDLLPVVFRADWGARVAPRPAASSTPPTPPPTDARLGRARPRRAGSRATTRSTLLAGCPLGADEIS